MSMKIEIEKRSLDEKEIIALRNFIALHPELIALGAYYSFRLLYGGIITRSQLPDRKELAAPAKPNV
jgi:hypothetical protein